MKPRRKWSEGRAIEGFRADTRKCLRVALQRAEKPSDRAHLKVIVAADEGRGVRLTADEVGYLGMDDALQTAAENIAWEVLTGTRS